MFNRSLKVSMEKNKKKQEPEPQPVMDFDTKLEHSKKAAKEVVVLSGGAVVIYVLLDTFRKVMVIKAGK
jgi:hypothetical protein